MNPSPVARLIRGWVDLYTRGVLMAVRDARRDEIDNDLWCQHEEAAALGRSPRSLAAEMVLRLTLGIPADVSWRLSHGGRAVASERSSSMGIRVIGSLAIIAGASWTFLVIRVLGVGDLAWHGPDAAVNTVLGLAGGVAITAATIGLILRFQDQVSALGAVGGALAGLGALSSAVGVGAGTALLPVGSAALIWDLARAGILSRALAIVHAVSAVVFLAPLIGIVIDWPATIANYLLVALAIPYMLTWIVIGATLLRGVPRAHEPAPSA